MEFLTGFMGGYGAVLRGIGFFKGLLFNLLFNLFNLFNF